MASIHGSISSDGEILPPLGGSTQQRVLPTAPFAMIRAEQLRISRGDVAHFPQADLGSGRAIDQRVGRDTATWRPTSGARHLVGSGRSAMLEAGNREIRDTNRKARRVQPRHPRVARWRPPPSRRRLHRRCAAAGPRVRERQGSPERSKTPPAPPSACGKAPMRPQRRRMRIPQLRRRSAPLPRRKGDAVLAADLLEGGACA